MPSVSASTTLLSVAHHRTSHDRSYRLRSIRSMFVSAMSDSRVPRTLVPMMSRQLGNRLLGFGRQLVGDAGGLLGERLHFAGDDAERGPGFAGPSRFDPRVEREQARIRVDVADFVDRVGQHARQIGHVAGDVLDAVGLTRARLGRGICCGVAAPATSTKWAHKGQWWT